MVLNKIYFDILLFQQALLSCQERFSGTFQTQQIRWHDRKRRICNKHFAKTVMTTLMSSWWLSNIKNDKWSGDNTKTVVPPTA